MSLSNCEFAFFALDVANVGVVVEAGSDDRLGVRCSFLCLLLA